eukprot:scaffold161810_cov16-Tisochrysis_lutea.AAC.2
MVPLSNIKVSLPQEGGGQIIRNSVALSAILKTPVDVVKIRAGKSLLRTVLGKVVKLQVLFQFDAAAPYHTRSHPCAGRQNPGLSPQVSSFKRALTQRPPFFSGKRMVAAH